MSKSKYTRPVSAAGKPARPIFVRANNPQAITAKTPMNVSHRKGPDAR